MTTNKSYNGHKNWNHWNVSLWINNDECLYELAQLCLKDAKNQGMTKYDAAHTFMSYLKDNNTVHTPDGAPYSVSSIRAAMVGIDK